MENTIKKYVFTDVVENKGHDFGFPNDKNKCVVQSYLRRRYIVITPCNTPKGGVARGYLCLSPFGDRKE